MNRNKIFRFSIILFPLFFLWLGFNVELAKFGNDPNYVYLVNSTALCDGVGVGYIDHPGTTVMQIGAITIGITHLINNPENQTLVDHVFTDSHLFILSIRNVLMVLNSIVLLLLGWIAYKKTDSVWVALLLQGSTFITSNTLDHVFTKVSPEPFLFFLTAVFVIVVLWFYADNNKNSWKYVIVFSLLIGAGLATKATFLPLAIFPLIVLPTLKKKLAYSVGVIPSFVLFTIPIIPEYEQMYYWFRRLMSHSGTYGHGKKGFIDIHTYFPDLLRIFQNNPIFGFVLLLGIVVVIIAVSGQIKKKSKIPWDIKILTALVASAGFGVLMVAKHYHSNHYLIPDLLLSGVILFFIHKVFERKKILPGVVKYEIQTIDIALVLFILLVQIPNVNYFNEGYKITNEEMDSTNAMIEKDYAGYTKIYYYPNSLNPYSALNFGDVYTRRRMLPQIKKVLGSRYFYHSFEKTIKNWDTEIYLEDLIKQYGNKIILMGGPHDNKTAGEISRQGFPLQQIYKGRIQTIYILDTLQYNRSKENKINNIVEVVWFGAEKVSANNKNLIDSNGSSMGNIKVRTNEKARTGTYSIKMDNTTEFALEYKLTNLKAGDIYEIEIWRNADTESTRLVVAAKNSNQFYKASNQAVQTDKKGWQLLRQRITVPENLQDNTLKIYLWNADRQLGYFDDFSITKVAKK